jgi:hypothetical protein
MYLLSQKLADSTLTKHMRYRCLDVDRNRSGIHPEKHVDALEHAF